MKKKMMMMVVAISSIFVVSQPSMAREFADIYTECGLGAIIAPRNSAVAAVTNVTWDSGTTAISSNISSPGSCAGGKGKTAALIHDAYEYLARDLSKGSGSYLNTLLTLSSCQPAARPAIIGALRNEFSKVVAKPGYSLQNRYEQAENFYDLFNNRIHADFANSCSMS